jgi:hypothetical protein
LADGRRVVDALCDSRRLVQTTADDGRAAWALADSGECVARGSNVVVLRSDVWRRVGDGSDLDGLW